MLAIEVDGTGFHEAGSKQAERDEKKNRILEKTGILLLRLRTDGSGEREKIREALEKGMGTDPHGSAQSESEKIG